MILLAYQHILFYLVFHLLLSSSALDLNRYPNQNNDLYLDKVKTNYCDIEFLKAKSMLVCPIHAQTFPM